MPVVRTYCCPDCEGAFDFLHMTRDEPPPAHCQLCHAFMGDVEPELPAVNIGGSNLSRSVDQVQQHMEVAYKQTDMNDGLRAGDVAAKNRLPSNEVTRVAAEIGHDFWQGGSTSAYIADAKKGGKGTGASVIQAIQERKLGYA